MVITEVSFQLVRMKKLKKLSQTVIRASILVNLTNKQQTLVTTMLSVQNMQSKLINLQGIINNNASCENKNHRHRKPYDGNFLAVINPTQGSIYGGIAGCHCRFPWLIFSVMLHEKLSKFPQHSPFSIPQVPIKILFKVLNNTWNDLTRLTTIKKHPKTT